MNTFTIENHGDTQYRLQHADAGGNGTYIICTAEFFVQMLSGSNYVDVAGPFKTHMQAVEKKGEFEAALINEFNKARDIRAAIEQEVLSIAQRGDSVLPDLLNKFMDCLRLERQLLLKCIVAELEPSI